MKVILLHEVPGLGQPGDVKDVANGYARNYLLPRDLVEPATPGALKNLQERVASAKRRADKTEAEYKTLADKLAAISLTFAVHVGRGDRLYGSVTSQNIADAIFEQEGLRIDRRTIHLPEPLRQLGTFEVPVRVAAKVEPKVKVSIVAAGAEGAPHTPEATPEEAAGTEAAGTEAAVE